MEQENLFHEDIYDVLRTCVQAMGGPKKVGASLWPELAADKAGNRLNDCLNTHRREQLNPEQVLWILFHARQVNCHAGMHFIADHCDYEKPKPIEPDNEYAQLQRDFIRAQKEMKVMMQKMEHMTELKAVVNK